MVKGTSRRVIVVRSPDERLFEQAIFLLRENALEGNEVTAQQVVKEAKEVADSYLRRNTPARKKMQWLKRYSRYFWFLAGAVCSGVICWLAVM